MDFKLTIIKEKEAPITTPLSVPVPEEMKKDIQRIKREHKNNSRMVNELARQFFAQLIEKYDNGEFEIESA
ncbi:MAG: hypothetical protein ACXVB1_08950 [Pseudobdellovibrionaceae bacterium]